MTRLLGATALAPFAARAADSLPIFDAHLHYSHDAVQVLPPADAVAILRKAGLKRAMVSSSDDAGTQKLYALAPELVLPQLRPYRRRSDLSTWYQDEGVLRYVEERIRKYKYVAIGEFHLYGDAADLPIPRRMVELAKQYRIFLHAHSDADCIDRLFRQDANARVLWAHSGFIAPSEVVAVLRRHKNLWCDLAFRSDQGSGGRVDAGWRAAFMEFPDRFMVGTDTFTPERWHYVVEHANYSRAWLADLPQDVAERIAWRNGERVFGGMMASGG
ncbi:MAG: amidohydrolase family protein [Reyranellaceae bacterium]